MGKSVAQLLCVRKRLVLNFKYLLETEEPSMIAAIIIESQNGFADIVRFMRCYCSRINVQVIIISVYESNNSPRGKML